MNSFSVDISKWQSVIDSLGKIDSSLNSAKNNAERVSKSHSITDTKVKKSLNASINAIERTKGDINEMRNALSNVMRIYITADAKVAGVNPASIIARVIANDAINSIADAITTTKKEHWWDNVFIDGGKAVFDIIGGFGDAGSIASIVLNPIKCLVDGKFTLKDWGSVIKSTGKGVISIAKNWGGVKDWHEFFGLTAPKTLTVDATAKWFSNAGKTFGDTFKDKFGIHSIDETTGEKVIKGSKVAGWALAFIASGFSNAEEYKKSNGTMSKGRAVAETISETFIDMGKGALISAGIAATCAAVGVSALAVVVGGIGVGISLGMDYIGKAITGDKDFSVTEAVSDWAVDRGEDFVKGAKTAISKGKECLSDVGKEISKAGKKAKKAVSSWARKITHPKFGFAGAGSW